MKIFGIAMIIIWLFAGVITLISNDKDALKINYIIMLIVLIFQLIDNYLVN